MKKSKLSVLEIGAIYTISNIVVKGIVFLTTPIFTRLMPQAAFGEFSSISSWANIVTTIITLNLYSSISVAKYDYNEKIDEYLSSILCLGNIITIICWGIIEIKLSFFENLLAMSRIYIRSIMLYALFYPAVQILLNKYRIYNDYKKVVLLTWITLLTSTCGSLGLVMILEDKLLGRVLGDYTLMAIVSIVFWSKILIKGKKISQEHWKYALHLSLPLIPHELAGILLNSSDRIIIKQLCGPEKAALYSLSYTVSLILGVFLSSANQAWVPWFYDNLNDGNYKRIEQASSIFINAFAILCLGMMLVGPEVVLIFGGTEYLEAKYVIPPVAFSIMVQMAYTLYVNIEFYEKNTIMISIATVGATIVNIVLNYILIPKVGYLVAAYTTVIGFVLMLLLHTIVVKKTTKYSEVFSMQTLIRAIFITVLGMVIISISYKYLIVRILLITIYTIGLGTILYKNKRTIIIMYEQRKNN